MKEPRRRKPASKAATPKRATPSPAPPQPVARTFFPKARPAPAVDRHVEVDQLLESLAASLWVGGEAGKVQRFQVTLDDPLFLGTELVIVAHQGEIAAHLLPPTLTTYELLSARISELEANLKIRGLKIRQLEVVRP